MAISGMVGRETIYGPGHPLYDQAEMQRASNDRRLGQIQANFYRTPTASAQTPPKYAGAATAARNNRRQQLGLDPIYPYDPTGFGSGATNPTPNPNSLAGMFSQITGSAGGAGGTGAGAPAGLNPGVVSAARRRLGTDSAPGVPLDPGATGAIQGQFSDAARQGMEASDIDLLREASFQSGKLNSDINKAVTARNLDVGQLLRRLYEMQLNQEGVAQGQFGDLLAGIGG